MDGTLGSACFQLLLALAKNEGKYATVGTPARFWSPWRELETPERSEDDLRELVNLTLSEGEVDRILMSRPRWVKEQVAPYGKLQRQVTEQDRLVYALCRPGRLLEMVYRYTLFDAGERKVARYQQYFCVRKILSRIRTVQSDGTRQGGVVWHTQGSGKSLTMVMLAEALALEPRLDPTLLRRVRHVTGENERVERFVAALESHAMIEAGEALYASHESLRVDYEVSWPEADWLVSRSRELRGMVGARMTGAGFGGCTLHLAQAEHAAALAARLQGDFEEAFGLPGRMHRLVASDGASLALGPAAS